MKHLIIGLSAVLLLFSSCENEPADPEIPNQEELITTVIYTLTPEMGEGSIELKFKDLDGSGNAEVTVSDKLKANTVYLCTLQLLNEVDGENITDEVEEEGVDHQFFFEPKATLKATIVYTDEDENGYPIGLETKLTTSDASTGTLTITLRHQPNKMANGVKEGDISNAGGETDITVTFDLEIE